jgi:DNA polymerase IV
MNEWVLHIDGDGFFAYCEISRFPHLKGKPVVVGEDRGIACAMTYEAKRLGITRGMPMFKIREQFPDVVRLSSHFELYEQYANNLATILEPTLAVLERYSIDECFGLIKLPAEWTREDLHTWLSALKKTVQGQLGLTYSFGLARTKVLAKIASKREKPDGCTVIMACDEAQALKETPIESLWGIGWKLTRRFQTIGVKTAYEFSQWSEKRVQDSFALPTQELWHELHGRVMFPVSHSSSQAKSLQATKSFTASTNQSFVLAELLQNTDIAFARMRAQGLVTNGVGIFLKTTERNYHSTSIIFPDYTDNMLDVAEFIKTAAIKLFRAHTRYRSTGITVWNLRPIGTVQPDLFDFQKTIEQDREVMKAIDLIRDRYGNSSIGTLASMPSVHDRLRKLRAQKESYESGLPLPYLGEVY